MYGIDLGGDVPVIFTTADPATGLDQHFRLQFDWRFVEVALVGPKPPLPDAVRQRLQTGRIDADLLRELLPPERFVLRGFMIVKAVDVTDQEVLSSLKRDLIDKDSIVKPLQRRAPVGRGQDEMPGAVQPQEQAATDRIARLPAVRRGSAPAR